MPYLITIYHADSFQVRRTAIELQLSPDAAYLLVGCLGGLGRSLTTWMMDKGCKNFAFLSRSGADRAEAAAVVAALQERGATVQVIRGDASRPDDVQRAVAQVSARKPIKGVVHAAMVLQVG